VIGGILNVFRVPEIRTKLLITVGFLLVYRIGWSIPIPGIDLVAIRQAMGGGKGEEETFAQLYNLISGGGVYSFALFSLGIMPYISSSIIFSLLTKVVPSLEAVAKEGASGQRKINQWTRLATIPIAMLQAIILVTNVYTRQSAVLADRVMLPGGFWAAIGAVFALTAGCVLLMWIGEQITEHGVGNGISLLIMAGIIARVPQAVMSLIEREETPVLPFTLIILFFLIVVAVVYVTKGMRKIPVQYAKLTRGRRVYGGQRHFLPIKVNQSGVMPVIFASALLSFPMLLGQALNWQALQNSMMPGSWWYTVLNTVLIFFFTFFWNSLMFNPAEMSKNMKEYGSFVPGIRPGKKTAEFLQSVMSRMSIADATFLSLIAVIPQWIASRLGSNVPAQIYYFLGGTSILIVVSVALDLVDKLNSALLMRSYDGFMGSGGAAAASRRKR
jgi:preprotein translocase subunit SecY